MKIPKINELCLEYLAYWESGLQASRLARILGQSREHVQRKTISTFEHTYPVPLINAGKRMRKLADTSDGLRFAPSRPSDLMRMLDGVSVLFQNSDDDYPFGVRLENPLSGCTPEPDAEIFRALYAACAQKCAVIVQYRSKGGVFPMTFSPHALVQVPDRVHFRGYAQWAAGQERGRFIDLVPARVLSIEHELLFDAVPSAGDIDWHTKSDAAFRLSEDLPAGLRAVVSQEWGSSMTDRSRPNTMVIPSVRTAVRLYVNRALRYRWFGDTLYETWLPEPVK
ncbi:MAG: hypothetical protein JSR42_21065 [Proteobacteria bacterium]|nr:hypothetical protein [Pseudomonadota bacterium]